MRQGRFEAMLLRWLEGSSQGCVVTLLLPDPSDLEPFKAMTLAKKSKDGGMAGQILEIEWREQTDEEPPITPEEVAKAFDARVIHSQPRTVGPLCLLAVRWCKDPLFQEWLSSAYAKKWEPLRELPPEEWAKRIVLDLCKIPSRTELDENGDAARDFDELIRKPFMFVAAAHVATHAIR